MKPITIILIILLFNSAGTTQNLINNSSFEEARPYTHLDNHSQRRPHFSDNMRFWNTPTGGTPDIILEEYYSDPKFAKDKGPAKPRTGESMIGIRVFGCYSLGDHCREFIQTKTKETLKKGKCYEYEYYVQPNYDAIRINSVGIGFSIYELNDLTMQHKPDVQEIFTPKKVLSKSPGNWVRVKGMIIPKEDYNHIIIGNYNTDTETKFLNVKGGSKHAYYYIDDVSIYELDCITKKPKNKTVTYTVPNINFMVNSSILDNSSDIRGIYDQIISNGFSRITINGYTDDSGSDEYNLKLSQKRADYIRSELIGLGIPDDKITAVGLGNSNPIDDIDKAKNRRVEIVVR